MNNRWGLILCLCFYSIWAQAVKTVLPISALDGEMVTHLQSDGYGRMWIGTTKGIFLYDGTTLHKYKRNREQSTSLQSLITHLYSLQKNGLVGVTFNGLYRYDPQKDDFLEIESQVPLSSIIYVYPNGNVLALSPDNHTMLLLDANLKKVLKQVKSDKDMHITSTLPLSNGSFVFESRDGFSIYSAELILIKDIQVSTTINQIQEIQNRLVVASNKGIETYSKEGTKVSNPQTLERFTQGEDVKFLVQKDQRTLFFGLVGKGIYSYDLETEDILQIAQHIQRFPLNERAQYMGMDSAHRIWLRGLNDNHLGIQSVKPDNRLKNWEILVNTDDTRLFRRIAQFTEWKGNVYFLTDTSLFKYDKEKRSYSALAALPDKDCKDIAVDSFGHFYVLSDQCIYIYEEQETGFRMVKQVPGYTYGNSLYAVTEHFVTFMMQHKLVSLDDQLRVIEHPFPEYSWKASICPAQQNDDVWVFSGNNNSSVFHPQKGFLNTNTKLPQNLSISYSARSGSGHLWLATEKDGLVEFHESTGRIDTLSIAQGLPDNHLYNVKVDNWGNVWVSTTNGLARYAPETGVITDYEELGNLLFDLSYNHLKSSAQGDIYVHSSKCILKYSPLPDNEDTPPNIPLVNQATVNGKQIIGMPQSLNLRHNENDISFHFVSVDMLHANLIIYEYMLEGADDEWRETRNGEVLYTNIQPGNYLFKVRARYLGGGYSDPVQVTVHIKPAFYQTLWFFLLILVLLVSATTLFIRFLIRTRISLAEYKFRADKERMKVNLYTNLSHLIRTPVSLVNAPFKQLVDRHDWDEKDQKLIQVIEKNMVHIMDLTQQFLESWSTSQEAADPMDLTLHITRKNVTEIVRETALVFRPTAAQKGITITLDTPESLVLPVDEDKIVKILYNLVSNALKHTPRDGQVRIAAIQKDHQLEFSVSDTGDGISDSKKKRIFELFYTESKQEKKGDSFGIGLYHTRQLVELYKGTIEVKDNKPNGAIFTLCLPVNLQPEEEKKQEEVQSPALNDEVLFTSESTHVLLVEDNEDMLSYLASNLQDKFAVSTARDGMEAMKYFGEESIDLVITDVMMPRMDGFALCRWIKDSMEYCHIPVVILTAKSAKTDELEGLGCGGDYYLKKPFEMDILQAVTQTLLDNRRKVQKALQSRLLPSVANKTTEDAPQEEGTLNMNAKDKEMMDKLHELLEAHLDDEKYGNDDICAELGFSKSNFYKKIKALTGSTPNEIITGYRFRKVLQLMEEEKYTLSEIAYKTGFSSISVFSRRFKSIYGMSPSEYLEKKGLK